jgi:hypothetical protein
MRNNSGKEYRENQNTHFVFYKFVSKNCAVYEIMWKNVVQQGGSQMSIVQERKDVICMQDN